MMGIAKTEEIIGNQRASNMAPKNANLYGLEYLKNSTRTIVVNAKIRTRRLFLLLCSI
jgi:hypothetical protein